MNSSRLLILLVVTIAGVIAQNVYLNRLADLLKRVDGMANEMPALRPCLEGVPLDVNSWVQMDVSGRKAALIKLSDQTKDTLLALTKDPSMDAQKILNFDAATLDIVNVVVDGTTSGQLTAAPSTTAPTPAPAATTAAPVVASATSAPTKPVPTTEAPKATEAPASNTTAPVKTETETEASGSSDTAIDTVDAGSLASTEVPTTTAAATVTVTPVLAKSSNSVVRMAAPVLLAATASLFLAIQ